MWLAFAIPVVAALAYYGARVANRLLRKQDDDLLSYCIGRVLVICPRCRSRFEVARLEEQMNTVWECEVCHTRFREYATHTATEEEGL